MIQRKKKIIQMTLSPLKILLSVFLFMIYNIKHPPQSLPSLFLRLKEQRLSVSPRREVSVWKLDCRGLSALKARMFCQALFYFFNLL